jgi:ABC-type Fe3+-hydroxamate transport system substrate-binding protein
MLTTDQTGFTLDAPSTPRRIVSLVPSQTELLHTLGLEDEVVGITRFCIHPETWRRGKTRIGGTKDADVSKIRSLQPDLVIANKEENLLETVSEIRSFCPVWTSDVCDIPGALDMVLSIGSLVGRERESKELVESLNPLSAMRLVPRRRRAVYLVWKDPWMAAGGDTFIHDMMRCAGLSNAFEDRSRYPSLTLDEMSATRSDLLLLSSEPYPFRERHVEELKKAFPHADVALVDGEMFSWYGSRMVRSIPYLDSLRERYG